MNKVLLAMSGGVDSSVAAYLLKEMGYDVIGVFMKNWEGENGCTTVDDSNDALIVANQLNIPFRVVDFREEYKSKILDYMISEYKVGRTPNPDVYCNKLIKFGHFDIIRKSLGCDYIATGHYASIKDGNIYKGIDPTKDQSYFLSNVTLDQISKMLLPLGDYNKSQIRDIASSIGLTVADKKDSQGLCFVGDINFQEFLSRYIPENPGSIIDLTSGAVLGNHNGHHHYTIGQRTGLKINWPGPWWVVKKDANDNIIYVVHNDNKDKLYKDSFRITNMVSHCPKFFREDEMSYTYPLRSIDVVIRYHGDPIKCSLINGQVHTLDGKFSGVAPGQIAAFYDGRRLLGSGVITA